MIIPSYQQSTSPALYGAKLLGKWYCSYQEEREGVHIARYMTSTGWGRCTQWWDTKEEVEAAFKKFGQNTLPITDRELHDRRVQEADYKAMMSEDHGWDDPADFH